MTTAEYLQTTGLAEHGLGFWLAVAAVLALPVVYLAFRIIGMAWAALALVGRLAWRLVRLVWPAPVRLVSSRGPAVAPDLGQPGPTWADRVARVPRPSSPVDQGDHAARRAVGW